MLFGSSNGVKYAVNNRSKRMHLFEFSIFQLFGCDSLLFVSSQIYSKKGRTRLLEIENRNSKFKQNISYDYVISLLYYIVIHRLTYNMHLEFLGSNFRNSKNWKTQCFGNVAFLKFLELLKMAKVQNSSNIECYIPSKEPFRFSVTGISLIHNI
jgi:hypothetical protein